MGKSGCVKIVFIILNVLFLLSGIGLTAVGIMSRPSFAAASVIVRINLTSANIVMIVVGISLVLMSSIGCFGAMTNSRTLLGMCLLLLDIIIILEVALGVVLYVYSSKITAAITKRAHLVIDDYKTAKLVINLIQLKLHCCGVENYSDWYKSRGWAKDNAVPDSCCSSMAKGCGADISKVYQQGCVKPILAFLKKCLLWIAVICVIFVSTEVLQVVLGVCLLFDLKKKNYENIK